MDTPGSTDNTYNYNSPWNALPALIGAAGGYMAAEWSGYSQYGEVAALLGFVVGVSLTSRVYGLTERIRSRVAGIR